jgi:hypothetical protein
MVTGVCVGSSKHRKGEAARIASLNSASVALVRLRGFSDNAPGFSLVDAEIFYLFREQWNKQTFVRGAEARNG